MTTRLCHHRPVTGTDKREDSGPLLTDRLTLREWQESDLLPFAQLNTDPDVLRYFVGPLSRAESDAFVNDRIRPHFASHGYGLWAVERNDTQDFIGFVGLMWQTFAAHFTPALEIGWRLARPHWGYGFATEAADCALEYAFYRRHQDQVVSMTAVDNARSIAVMRRLGMTRDPEDDFDHPRVPDGHPVLRHALFRITPEQWRARTYP